MLTARREEQDRIRGLSLGADDYLTKPFSPQELVLRVGAILRRVSAAASAPADMLTIGPVTIDRAAHRVRVDGRAIELTATEFKLLLALAERRGRVQGRAHLLETVWEAAPDIQTRTVDMHVQRLRTKLGEAGDLIETVRGFGYRMKSNQAASRSVRLTKRLLLGALAVVGVLVAVVVSDRRQSSGAPARRRNAARARARGAARRQRTGTPGSNADSLAHTAGAALGHRVTLIRPDGVVIGDAEFERRRPAPAGEPLHSARKSPRRASRLGRRTRPSPSDGDDQLYVAIRTPLGVARVSMPHGEVPRRS